jgi:ABC-type branched-subunit amino acid transport system substrate-binding protein
MSKLRFRRMGLLVVLVAMVALLAACAGEKAPVKFGSLMAITGDLGWLGGPIANGPDLAAKHINEAGGILGAKVEIVLKDSQTSPQAGADAARSAVDIDKVVGIVGALSSGVTLAAAESATIPNKVVLISPASTSPALTALDDDDYVFRTTSSDELQGLVLGMLAKELGFNTASTMYVNNAYGQGLSEEFAKAFKAAGGTVLAEVPHEQVQPTYAAELRRALEGNPDVLLALSYPESANIYLTEAIEGGYTGKFLFCDGTQSIDLVQSVGAQYLNGTYGTVAGTAETDALLTFKDAYEAEYGELPPQPYIDTAYDAVVLMALAAQKAGKADGTSIRDNLRAVANPPGEVVGPGVDGIKRALDLIKQGKDINYEGAGGSQDFDEYGNVLTPIKIWKIDNGEIVDVRFVTVTP